jgi:hypothetical protein
MTTATISPASSAQLSFIESLLESRAVDPVELDVIRTNLPFMSKKDASRCIDMLKLKPFAPKDAAVPSELQTKLASIPKSKYAIPVEELEFLELDSAASIHGDLLFLEVREYMHTLYMRRLTGSVGAFTRHKLTKNDTITLVDLIARDPYKYAKLFGLHYSCCGKCGAELTDPVSRKFQLGPDCRKVFGF